MSSAGFECSALSDRGRRRDTNEDATLALPEAGVFAVADGLGGAAGGEVASQELVASLAAAFQAPAASLTDRIRAVKSAIENVNARIKLMAEERHMHGMGTTAVVLVFDRDHPASAAILHAGDSRAYLWRQSRLAQLTEDHSLGQALGVGSVTLLPPAFRGIVTRAIGVRDAIELDVTPVNVEPLDILLLCSDGLSGMLTDDALSQLIQENASKDMDSLAQALIAAANSAGGDDNISVVLVRLLPLHP